jgi:hypothetical protein
MEERVKRVERQFVEWVEGVRLDEDTWFPELEHMVLRFLMEKQKKYRKIETLNRMLFGARVIEEPNYKAEPTKDCGPISKADDTNGKVDKKKMFGDKQVSTSKRVTFGLSA